MENTKINNDLYDLNFYVENINKIHTYNNVIKDIEYILTFKDEYYFLHFNNLIEKNPLITLMLLKSSNNPLFEFDKISNLSLAFNIFGLESLRGFLLEYYINRDYLIYLEAIYSKDINHLIYISNLRKNFLSLLLKKTIKLEKNYLESTIFISDLGLLYTSDIIFNLNTNIPEVNIKVEEFNENLTYNNIWEAENILLNFNNYEFLSKLLKKWNFPPIVYELIKNIPLDNLNIDEENIDLIKKDFYYDLNLIKLSNKLINFENKNTLEENLEESKPIIENLNLNVNLIKEILEELKSF